MGERRILVVDDDGHIREVVKYALEQAGFSVVEAVDGRHAWTLFEQAAGQPTPVGHSETAFDLVVLDILMPGLDGLDVCRRIRQLSRVPIIFLSSKDEELDRVLGLELGADDYVAKPFSPRELVARVKAALRRYDEIQELASVVAERKQAAPEASDDGSSAAASSSCLSHGELVLDLARHECRVRGAIVVLTVSEFALLEALLQSPTHVLSRAQLVERAYGEGHFLSDRTVDSHIRRVRSKLRTAGCECIETVYGVGYRLRDEEP